MPAWRTESEADGPTPRSGAGPRNLGTRLGQRPGWLGRLIRAGATSIMATVLSHGVYVGLLGLARADAAPANAIAFGCGAAFNFLVGRRFTWGRRYRPHPVREMLPYLAVIGCTGLFSVGVAAVTQHLIVPLELSNGGRTLMLELANIASYGLVFFVKFVLLDRLVFRDH